MNKRLMVVAIALIITLLAVPAFAQQRQEVKMPDKKFTTVNEMWRSDVLSQGRTGTCWSFSATSFMESEVERLGKGKHDLSEIFTVFNTYLMKGDYYIRMQGNNTFAEGGFSHNELMVLKNIGAVPNEVFNGLWEGEPGHDHSELVGVLKSYLDTLLKQRGAPSQKWSKGFKAILEAYLGNYPAEFEYQGKKYTPKSYAAELGLNPDDYVHVTSYTYLPFWKQGEHIIPDNWCHADDFYNVPLDDYIKIFDYALRNGFTTVVSADVSEPMFSMKHGYAVLPGDLEKDAKLITQEEREEMWNNGQTTDDHGMHGVGVATDEDGNVFYLVKNSWGAENGPYAGHIYMGQNYMRAKLHTFMVHKDGIPKEYWEKLGIK